MSFRLGLFGGTFDPIHNAHLHIAHAFAAELALKEVRLIPAGEPYHRLATTLATAQQRLDMVQLAIAQEPLFKVDQREVLRHQPTYTIDTLHEIRQEIGPNATLWFLIGTDSFITLHTWHRWQELLPLANLAIAIRPGFCMDTLPDPLAELWRNKLLNVFPNSACSGTIYTLTVTPVDLAATDVRHILAGSAPETAPIHSDVLAYIRQHHLYHIH